MTSSNGNIFRVTGHFAGNSPVNSPHKGQWRGALMFSLICIWINDWVNNREASDLRRYRAHYDVIVMTIGHHCVFSCPSTCIFLQNVLGYQYVTYFSKWSVEIIRVLIQYKYVLPVQEIPSGMTFVRSSYLQNGIYYAGIFMLNRLQVFWYRLRRSWNPVTQSRAFHCHFAHTRAFSLYGLSPGRRQAIIWTKPGMLLIRP